jgi:hypothetical protein
MASRAAVVPVILVVLLLAALAVFAPIIARQHGVTWLPTLTATQKNTHNLATAVWVNRRSGFYYCHASKFYGRIHPGFLMRQGSALGRGYRPAEGELCP